MPNAYILNQRFNTAPSTYGPLVSMVVEMLVSAGWNYISSGDGSSTYSPPSVSSTVTITIASPAVVTWTSHGLTANTPVKFTTTGTLPTNIVAGTTYYVVSTGLTASSFRISATPGGAAINTTGSQSGTHTGTSQSKAFSQTGSGTGGWGNSRAWARIQDPGGGREFIFQNANTGSMRIKYSASAKFTGGSPAANTTPSATDERYILGSGTDASPTYATFWPYIDTSNYPNIVGVMWQGAALSTAPYGFWFASQVVGTNIRLASMLMDPVVGDASDPDPVVISTGNSTVVTSDGTTAGLGGLSYSQNNNSIGARIDYRGGSNPAIVSTGASGTWAHMDLNKSVFMQVRALGYGCGNSSNSAYLTGRPDISASDISSASASSYTQPYNQTNKINFYGAGVNPFNGEIEYLPVLWSRQQTAALPRDWATYNSSGTQGASTDVYVGCIKGWSTMLRWTCMNRASFVDTLDDKSKICVGAWWLPWDGVTTPQW